MSDDDRCPVPVTRRLRADDPWETKREACGLAFPCAVHGTKEVATALAQRMQRALEAK